MSQAKRDEIKAEMDALQVWFAGHSRDANPEGWDYRSKWYDELDAKLADAE